MRLKILVKVETEYDVWECIDEQGGWHKVDFIVDGGPVTREQLVPGAVVEVESLSPYIEIATEVRLVGGEE